jgi:hypothetical protein
MKNFPPFWIFGLKVNHLATPHGWRQLRAFFMTLEAERSDAIFCFVDADHCMNEIVPTSCLSRLCHSDHLPLSNLIKQSVRV